MLMSQSPRCLFSAVPEHAPGAMLVDGMAAAAAAAAGFVLDNAIKALMPPTGIKESVAGGRPEIKHQVAAPRGAEHQAASFLYLIRCG
jgi:hypothetical protein